MTVSLVVTVKNEEPATAAFVAALLGQTRRPDEIVIVDGGSTDGTADTLRCLAAAEPRIRVLRAEGANISQGRNVGIQAAVGEVIAVTDAGTTAHPDWLAQLLRPLEADSRVAVSGGFFLAGGDTFFERCLSTVITPQLPEIDPEVFLPSSRSVAFRKEWWSRVGGYPEWLRHCEDLIFDLALRRAGAPFAFAPDAIVVWRARPTLSRFFWQYFDYARGDGHCNLWPLRHGVRYAAYLTGAALVALSLRAPAALLILSVGMAVYWSKFVRRIRRFPPEPGSWGMLKALGLLPIIVVTGDLAKMVGYPIGRWERRARRAASRQCPVPAPAADHS